MHSDTFKNTGGSIITKRSYTNPNKLNTTSNHYNSKISLTKYNLNINTNTNNNTSKFLSTTMNNRSITTNESSGINNASSIRRSKFNPRIRKPNNLTYVPLNTVGTDKSTWYHTKTIASIIKEKKATLKNADDIMKERHKMNLGSGFGYNDKKIDKILQKSREICLNNFMITQIRNKRTEINAKQFFVDRALKNSELQYENDYRAFIDFVEDIKKKEKKEEEILNKMKNKKDKTESRLNDELIIHKKLIEKCDIIIKTIVLFKSYGSFVHKVFHTPFIFDELAESKLNYKNDIHLKDKIIAVYEKSKSLPESYEEEINNILNYNESLMQQYSQYEEKLVVMLEDKNYINKEIAYMKMNSEREIAQLKKRLNEAENEYKKLTFEKKSILSSMKEYQINTLSEIDELGGYILELGIHGGVDPPRHGLKENMTDFLSYCKDIINFLGEREKMVNNYIEEIDEIIKSGNDKDKSIIDKLIFERKKLIKKEKQQKLKTEQDNFEKKKKAKAIERAKRIVIKGRKIYNNIAEWKRLHKDVKIKEQVDDDDTQNLFYSSDDD